MRKYVLVNRIREFHLVLPFLCPGALRIHLVDGTVAGSRHALVGAHHYSLDTEFLVKRREGEHHLYGGTVGVGDDVVVFAEHVGIDLRHH